MNFSSKLFLSINFLSFSILLTPVLCLAYIQTFYLLQFQAAHKVAVWARYPFFIVEGSPVGIFNQISVSSFFSAFSLYYLFLLQHFSNSCSSSSLFFCLVFLGFILHILLTRVLHPNSLIIFFLLFFSFFSFGHFLPGLNEVIPP